MVRDLGNVQPACNFQVSQADALVCIAGMGGGMRPFGGGTPASEHTVGFSLEELYKGCTKRLKVSRTISDTSGQTMRVQEPLDVTAKPGHKKGTKFTFAEKGRVRSLFPVDVYLLI